MTVPEIRDAVGIDLRQAITKTRANSSTINERERRALDLMVAGATYKQIATVLGLRGAGSAVQLCQRALAKRAVEFSATTLAQARALYVDRLESLYRRWLPMALGSVAQGVPPDPKAAEIVLKVMEREARVLGLDAPVQVEEHTTVVIASEELSVRRQRVLEGLAEVEARRTAIEGEFHVNAA